MEEEEEGEVGFAFPDVTAQLLLAAAGFQFLPLLTMDADDTESHFLPPPPGPKAVRVRRSRRRPESDRPRGGGRRRGASPAPPHARTPLAARTPAFHTRAHSRPGARRPCRGCCSAARRSPSRARRARRSVTRSRPPGL